LSPDGCQGDEAVWRRLDVVAGPRKNPCVIAAGTSRRELARTLNAAYADGLISETTFVARLEQVLGDRVIDAKQLVGDLRFRARRGSLRDRVSHTMTTLVGRLDALFDVDEPATLLALDWSGEPHELLIGRSSRCDIVLPDMTISRRHARLIFRDGKWVLQDLASSNGSVLNGRRVGRCELRPGDQLLLGLTQLRID
jgi:hypothetical protein